ncbi:hypothetical protein H0H92_002818 [Tricholoma furcatifolium]|nr:hypothetical protein H0H92_002818 [Tricholoma furcatifolium]
MHRPSLLTVNADPLDVLCRHFNVVKPTIPPSTVEPPSTMELSILRSPYSIPNASLPTHVLFVDCPSSGSHLALPIDAELYASGLRADLPVPESAPAPSLNSSMHTLTVPVVPLRVPHPPTLPLLLLFALSLETSPHTELAYRLLPPSAVEEFPNSAAMSTVLARGAGLGAVVERNEGMWRNVLALGVSDAKVVEMVGMVWSVTKEARRVRARMQAGGR